MEGQFTGTLLLLTLLLLDQLKPFEDFLAFVQKIDYGEPLYVNGQLIQIVLLYYFYIILMICTSCTCLLRCRRDSFISKWVNR